MEHYFEMQLSLDFNKDSEQRIKSNNVTHLTLVYSTLADAHVVDRKSQREKIISEAISYSRSLSW